MTRALAAAALPPPDFVIVGAPKCGTTALYSYLSGHPGIAMSPRKEPCFWSTDIEAVWRLQDRAAYDALWAEAPPGALRGEASSLYLQSRVAIPSLLAARPDVRLIAMIRNPVEMAASRHANLLHGSNEDVEDFEAAWRLQEQRRRGESLPQGCTVPGALQYFQNAAIGDQLESFLAIVPAGQRLVIVYEDFRADPRAEYLRALELLRLPDDGRMDFAPVHASRNLRISVAGALQRWLKRRMGRFYEPVRSAAHAAGFTPWKLLDRFTARSSPRKPLRPAFEEELIAAFIPQIEKVEKLLDRDLASWKIPRSRTGRRNRPRSEEMC